MKLSEQLVRGETSLGERMEARLPRMLDEIAALVDIESPSNDPDALRSCAVHLEALGSTLLGRAPERIEPGDGLVHLLWRFGDTPRIALVGHYDTVHPVGTVRRFPFSSDGVVARGPGVCDMKAGVVMALHALAELLDEYGEQYLDGVCLFVNADEEVGSFSSRPMLDWLATTAEHVLVFENAGRGGEIKTARRGVSRYELRAHGRAAHAGAEAAYGINALEELCRQAITIVDLADVAKGTSVVPTMASAGTTYNSIPAVASMHIDVRCTERSEQHRVDVSLRSLEPFLEGARLELLGGVRAGPMPAHLSEDLYEIAASVWAGLGFGHLPNVLALGSSDANHIASFGVRVIDGLGAAGGDDHSDREWIDVESVHRRAALAAGIVEELVDSGRRVNRVDAEQAVS